METETMYIIDQKEGFSPEFGKLISMMNYTRMTTIREVENLTVEELDFQYDEDANSIGMLLAHMIAVEKAYHILTFEKRDIADDDIPNLNPGLELGSAAQEQIKGNTSDYYLNELAETRNKTVEIFKSLPDEWLFEQVPFWEGLNANNYFQWFHVFEDELSHRGQIRIIKKMISKRS